MAAVEGAGVCVIVVCAYRCPVHICEIDVFSQSNVDTEITVVGYVCHSLQSLGGGHGVVALSVVGISLILIQRDIVELARYGSDAGVASLALPHLFHKYTVYRYRAGGSTLRRVHRPKA